MKNNIHNLNVYVAGLAVAHPVDLISQYNNCLLFLAVFRK